MKRIVVFIIAATAAVSLVAQNAEKRWAVGLGPGYYFNLNDDFIGGLTFPNLNLSSWLTPSFDLRGKFSFGLKQRNELNTNFYHFGLDLVFKLRNGHITDENSGIKPYFYAGPGFFMDNRGIIGNVNYNGGLNFNGGIGTKLSLSRRTALIFEAGYLHGVKGVKQSESGRQEVHDNFLTISGIIEFSLSGK